MGEKKPANDPMTVFTSKKCPNCLTYLSLDARRCTACGARVGPVTRDGKAKKVFNPLSYIYALFAIGLFGLFIWWAFLR